MYSVNVNHIYINTRGMAACQACRLEPAASRRRRRTYSLRLALVPLLISGIGQAAAAARISDGIARRLQTDPAMKTKHPVAPCRDRIAVVEKTVGADAPRPLEGTEQNVIGVHRAVAGKKRSLAHDGTERLQRPTQIRHLLIPVGDDVFEGFAEALLPRRAEIVAVLFMDMGVNVGDDQRRDRGMQDAVGPGVYELRQSQSLGAAEERWPVGIGRFEILRNPQRIRDCLLAINEHWDLVLARKRDSLLLGEPPRDRFVRQALVGECHPRPPAVRAEAAIVLLRREFVKFHSGLTPPLHRAQRYVTSLPGRVNIHFKPDHGCCQE